MEELFSSLWVEAQVAKTIDEWDRSGEYPALGGERYTLQEQMKRETAYDDGLRAVENDARQASRGRTERLAAQRHILAEFPRFASIALGLEEDAIHLLTDGFLPVGTQFAQWAHRFDSSLTMQEIIQACRNTWTACGLQPLLGDPMQLTPSILGYSLLYPYSDNYLDHKSLPTAQKLEFSSRFRQRLRGYRLAPRNRHEAAVWAMVQLAEEQYPRSRFPQVFNCLLAIHCAQEESISQLKGCGNLTDDELMRISCAKGGTSVLADACLSHGWLNDEESRIAFEWGFLLQLGDDLQDVREDLRRGSGTLFSRAIAARRPLDSLVIQLLAFSDCVADRIDRLPHGTATLKNLLRMSWRSLILMAAANAEEFFSPAFLVDLEPRSPFRFKFLRSRNKKLTGRRGLYKTLFEAFMEDSRADSSNLPEPEQWMEYTLDAETEAVA
jgi:hypothetical protein